MIISPVPVPDAALPLPDPSDLATWGARMAEMHRWMRQDLRPGSNLLAESAYQNALDAMNSALVAAGTSGFRGSWSAQTGAASLPYAVWHSGRVWSLLTPLADVTTSEPGASADWADVGGVKRSGDNMIGPLTVPAGATGAQAIQAQEVDTKLTSYVGRTGSTASAVIPSGTTAQRDGSPVAGYTRFNSTLGCNETYNGSDWVTDTNDTGWLPVSGVVDITGIPTWARRVAIFGIQVSKSDNTGFLIQLGSSAGFVTTGYVNGNGWIGTGNVIQTSSNGIPIFINLASAFLSFGIELTSADGLLWGGFGTATYSSSSGVFGAHVLLPGLLDRIRFTGQAGTPDAGQIMVRWEK